MKSYRLLFLVQDDAIVSSTLLVNGEPHDSWTGMDAVQLIECLNSYRGTDITFDTQGI